MPHLKKAPQYLLSLWQRPLIFLVDKKIPFTRVYDTSSVGAIIIIIIMLQISLAGHEEAVARAVCLGSHAALGDYGG